MQGIFINFNRPKSKKEVKETIASNPDKVRLEATSIFGNEYDGLVSDAPDGTYNFVGPNPFTDRKFYGTIKKNGTTIKVS